MIIRPEDLISYFPEKDYNGVLILLREPNDPNSPEKLVMEHNQSWIHMVLATNEKGRSVSRYRNRFAEMLQYVGLNPETELSHIAYANIKQTGGGASSDDEYWNLSSEEKKARFALIQTQVNPQIVFTVYDIFNSITEGTTVTRNGIQYKRRKNPKRKAIDKNGIIYYEILHPSWSPKAIHQSRPCTDRAAKNG